MGQGFADEIFRVFALEHPQVTLRPVNMIPEGKLPQELPEGTAFTHLCACIASTFQQIGNLTYRRKRPAHVDYDHMRTCCAVRDCAMRSCGLSV